MNRYAYKNCRRLIRDNGYYALRWMSANEALLFDYLRTIQNSTDPLAERAQIVSWCTREGIPYNFRHLANF